MGISDLAYVFQAIKASLNPSLCTVAISKRAQLLFLRGHILELKPNHTFQSMKLDYYISYITRMKSHARP